MHSFGQAKVTERIEGIELLRKHENLPEGKTLNNLFITICFLGYKMEYETILDDTQLKKLKILKMKYNAEKIQHKNIGISKFDINQMAGEKQDIKLKKQINKSYQEDEDEEEELNESDIESNLINTKIYLKFP